MKLIVSLACAQALALAVSVPLAVAQSRQTPAPSAQNPAPQAPAANDLSSSSSYLPDAPPPPQRRTAAETAAEATDQPRPQPHVRAFSALAGEVKVGLAGIGFETATPLNSFLNLRAGAQFFQNAANPNANGIHSFGQLTLQNIFTAVDIFPFQHSSFHLSPGLTLHNDTHLTSNLFVPAGGTFALGDVSYTSDPTNPIKGISRIRFGNPVAPRLTAGWGNMLPGKGSNFSIPFEIGFQYISSPHVELNLTGNACDTQGNCADINSPDSTTNLDHEVQSLNKDISRLRFYPIASVGLSYRFGHLDHRR